MDRYTFRIVLSRKYPQFLYWLAMPFFSPIPEEAVRFYAQGPLIRRNITLDQFPVGTGPYRLERYNPNLEIVFVQNENYHGERYPTEGAPEDRAAGLLQDAGKPMPFIPQVVYKLEKEGLPRWNKFLQGYYDASGISEESFDQAVVLAETGPQLTPFMEARGIQMSRSVETTTMYFAFNMRDPVVGGLHAGAAEASAGDLNCAGYGGVCEHLRQRPGRPRARPGAAGHLRRLRREPRAL
ncbi:MAG: hypothetical protein KatS3mg115_0418 [Candidatus Poribacteria bacterium]|nr:MAG: hypothetical protein KatS3mg115_0418 [Candidatus Poribacteria bacterium]